MPGKEVGSISQENLCGWVSLDSVCLSVCIPETAEAAENREDRLAREFGTQMCDCSRVRRKVLPSEKKTLLCPSLPPQASHFPSSRDVSLPCIPPSLPPTFFPFLTSYSMVKCRFDFCCLPSHCSSPFTSPPPKVSLCSFSCLVGNSTSPRVPAPPL